jgi:hypothetical protein
MHPEEPGDTYLNDGIIYRLTVELRVIVTEPMTSDKGRGGHSKHGQWWWVNDVPEDVILEHFRLLNGKRECPHCHGSLTRYEDPAAVKIIASLEDELVQTCKAWRKAEERCALIYGGAIKGDLERAHTIEERKLNEVRIAFDQWEASNNQDRRAAPRTKWCECGAAAYPPQTTCHMCGKPFTHDH